MSDPKKPKYKAVQIETARWRLAMIWFPGCAAIFLILVGQSLMGAYGADMNRAWGWALPNFLPTLALMVSVFAADALTEYDPEPTMVRSHFCTFAMMLSVFYVATMLLSLLIQPFVGNPTGADDSISARLELLEASNMWLAPLQSLSVATIGVLFFLKDKSKPQSEGADT